jgi:starvation-inducible outer membrane lipoprotein
MEMTRILVGVSIVLAACASPEIFPQSLVSEMETDKHLVQMGGRIVTATRQDGVRVLAEKLPIRHDDPREGPDETVRSDGWFMVSFGGDIEELGLKQGNKFVAAGKLVGTQSTDVNRVEREVPNLVTRCLHIWKTGRERIADFPHLKDGYYPLPRETYCK